MQTYPPGTRIGQYEIASPPMMGGMGVVYFALDHGNDGRPVALKTFRPELLPDRAARDRFLREGTAWIELGSHPHIVRCYHVGYVDPTSYLALELIAKEQNMSDASLRSWLIPGRPLPIEQSLLFALQVARGMRHATEKIPGFVHRDLKPENILVGSDKLPNTVINRVRITDFGLLKTVTDEISSTREKSGELKFNQVQFTQGAGTPRYMAPEQWKGEQVGVFTDIYAFGCILYEMLSGQFATRGSKITELQLAHCTGDPPSLPHFLPQEVHLLVEGCLVKDPINRYSTWNELAALLESAYQTYKGLPAPQLFSPEVLQQKERLMHGWSFNAMGMSFLDIGKTKVALQYFQKSLEISETFQNADLSAAVLGNLGNTFFVLGDFQQAIDYQKQSLAVARKFGLRLHEGNALGMIGGVYLQRGEIQLAIEYTEQWLKITKEVANKSFEAKALANLASAYSNLDDSGKAIKYYEVGLNIAREVGDRRLEGNNLCNIGILYEKLGQTEQAIICAEKSLTVAREVGNHNGEGITLGLLGHIYRVIDNQRAREYYLQALEIFRETDDFSRRLVASSFIAMSYCMEKNYIKAFPYAQEAVFIGSQIETPDNKDLKIANSVVLQLEKLLSEEPYKKDLLVIAGNVFESATTPAKIQLSVIQYPFMKNNSFIQIIEEIIRESVPSEQKPAFEQRLEWLKQLAKK